MVLNLLNGSPEVLFEGQNPRENLRKTVFDARFAGRQQVAGNRQQV